VKPADIAIDLRPRSTWEAIDLGVAMYRSWFRPLMAAWLVAYVPLLCLCAGLFHERLWLAWLALWWLKPLVERFALHVASRATFGEEASVRQTLACWREVLFPLPWLWVTLARPLYVQRGYTMPVSQLERQRGAARRARERMLGRRLTSPGMWLTTICAHFELVIAVSLYVLAALVLSPQPSGPSDIAGHLFSGGDSGFGFADLLIQAVAMSLVGPLFVCSGFALYLNRRSQLEAWDIEVNLRRIEERRAPARPVSAQSTSRSTVDRTIAAVGPVAAAIALLLSLAAAPAPLRAETSAARDVAAPAPLPEGGADDAQDIAARTAMRNVMAAPEFQTTRAQRHLQARNRKVEVSQPSSAWRMLADWMIFLAESARAILWLIAAAAAVLLVALVFKYRVGSPPPPGEEPPATVLGVDVTPESLPADVAASARRLLAGGDARAALSLLYRGALSALVHQHRVALSRGSTESDVIATVRLALSEGAAGYLQKLIAGWSSTAYAGRPPDPAAGQRLCDEWPHHFGGPA